MAKILKFPDGFKWGASVASYQVEGDINNCDWSVDFPAGKACQYYSKYEAYFDTAKELNQNIHRFSLEWSRIQPEEGRFDRSEIEHCRKVLMALRKRGIMSMLTVWHLTLPIWFSKMGGWENPRSNAYFQQYLKFAAEELGDLVDYWIILNEPEIYISLAYFLGKFPPQRRMSPRSFFVYKNLINAHCTGYDTIHEIIPNAKVSSALNLTYVDSFEKRSTLNNISAKIWNKFRNGLFIDNLTGKLDFISVNYYFHDRIRLDIRRFPHILSVQNENKNVSDIGWEIYPEGIYHVLINLKRYNLPVFISENGLADKEDAKRTKFIIEHLKFIHKAIGSGVDVKGYLHWSLIDNFEWTFGFTPRFGLVEMNYDTMKTRIRPSAYEYAKICKENALDV
ncbi:MAG: glycoside hydrolase family 1 protein [Candidatus Paceibacterota bacterium]|jgi:beta-glucosidase